MNKRKLHHVWRGLQKLSYWYLLLAFLLWTGIAAGALRNNNLRAIQLRDNVLEVDKQNGDVEAALRELREFTYAHMNTNLASSSSVYPPIQLKYRYERLVEAALKKNQGSSTVYADAQAYCEKNFPESFYGAGRLPCIQQYIDSHPVKNAPPPNVPDSLYKFDFVSPTWSPDLAGWSIVLAALCGFMFIVRFVLERWMRAKLRARL